MSDLENIKSLNEQLVAIADKQRRMQIELDAALIGRSFAYRDLELVHAKLLDAQMMIDEAAELLKVGSDCSTYGVWSVRRNAWLKKAKR